jgi:hypothetical protein
MKSSLKIAPLLFLAVYPTVGLAADTAAGCNVQAEQILARLQLEVVGELNSVDVAAANRIILDVCEAREVQAEMQMEQAVQQARKESEQQANAWLTESADKPGNKRLKRKSH